MLEVSGLSVRYGHALSVLHGVDMQVLPGTVVALLGANGAGKTTLLRALTGLLSFPDGRITAGEVLFEGVPVGRASATALVRRGMAQVMEGRRIFAELTVEENLRAGRGHGTGPPQRGRHDQGGAWRGSRCSPSAW